MIQCLVLASKKWYPRMMRRLLYQRLSAPRPAPRINLKNAWNQQQQQQQQGNFGSSWKQAARWSSQRASRKCRSPSSWSVTRSERYQTKSIINDLGKKSRCLKYSKEGTVYCLCGICLVPSPEQTEKIKNRFEIISNPLYFIKETHS